MAGRGAARVGNGTIHGILHQMLLLRTGQRRATREREPTLSVRFSEEGAWPRVAGSMGSGGDGPGAKGGRPGWGVDGGVDVGEHDAASEAEWGGKGYARKEPPLGGEGPHPQLDNAGMGGIGV